MSRMGKVLLGLLLLIAGETRSQLLNLPARATNAPPGSEFAKAISTLERNDREENIYAQVSQGNIPAFLRKLSPIRVQVVQDGKTNSATYYVTADYLAIGSDDDYFLTPLSPIMAQRVADLVHCTLPTRKMVDDIYSAAELKMVPSPIPPSPVMATVPIFIQHNQSVWDERQKQLKKYPLGTLVAGHKKDVVIDNKLLTNQGKVAIYGWHKPDGKPIQPLFTGHGDTYADYSHGIRLVQIALEVNGRQTRIPEVLADPVLTGLVSDEGTMSKPRYPVTPHSTASGKPISLNDFHPSAAFNEQTLSYTIEPEINVHINAPAHLDPHKKLQLVFYTLPNGNTIEQTIGRKTKAQDDWHFDIQHIGAQTRFLREVLKDYDVVVVYLEAGQKSWPAWRKKHADQPRRIPEVVDAIKGIFKMSAIEITLSGHSGGGSFIFGYLNGMDKIPEEVGRIAFLDSNYAYDEAQGHKDKLVKWLEQSDRHHLVILAYNDSVALLNDKTFVSAAGGTWGRSHQMIRDFEQEFKFRSRTNAGFETYTALDGRVQFLLKENPEKKVFHTVQVERNGFIQSVLSGTTNELGGYIYFGPRAYTKWISDE
jgi:hypothetical protein